MSKPVNTPLATAPMPGKPARSGLLGQPISRRTLGLAAAGAVAAAVTPFHIVRAQGGPLKIGVILPKSGFNAPFGQSCERAVKMAPELLKEFGFGGEFQFLAADTQSSVDVARSETERVISEGATVLTGAFDSGQTAAIAQVAEQHGVPFVINIAAADQLTQQGYQFVFRDFPKASQLIGGGLKYMKELFAATGHTPKTAVLLHLNDTYGMSAVGAINKLFPTLDMPFKILDAIAYDPKARDLSVEVSRAKATNADFLMVVCRINDAILIVRELVKQRWSPQGIICPGGPGLYDQQFLDTMGKYADYAITNTPWVNPKSPYYGPFADSFKKHFPNDKLPGHVLNVGFTFDAFLVMADAFKRAKSAEPKALQAALRATRIEKHMMLGGPIEFDSSGQNDNIAIAAVQDRGGAPVVVLPAASAVMKPVFPAPPWDQRA